jgi:hypothetical protein
VKDLLYLSFNIGAKPAQPDLLRVGLERLLAQLFR